MWRIKPLDAILATAEKKSLHRSLGPVQLTLLGIGAIIGTGIFVLKRQADAERDAKVLARRLDGPVVAGEHEDEAQSQCRHLLWWCRRGRARSPHRPH